MAAAGNPAPDNNTPPEAVEGMIQAVRSGNYAEICRFYQADTSGCESALIPRLLAAPEHRWKSNVATS